MSRRPFSWLQAFFECARAGPLSRVAAGTQKQPFLLGYRPPELENPWLPPAAKVVAEICATVEVAVLAGENLTDYLRTTSADCLGVSKVVGFLKGKSAIKLLDLHPELRRRFWGRHFLGARVLCEHGGLG